MSDAKKYGTIFPARTLILRFHVGEAKGESGIYEMSTTNSGEPLVRSLQTNKYFSLNWESIIRMAIELGIDEKDATAHKP